MSGLLFHAVVSEAETRAPPRAERWYVLAYYAPGKQWGALRGPHDTETDAQAFANGMGPGWVFRRIVRVPGE